MNKLLFGLKITDYENTKEAGDIPTALKTAKYYFTKKPDSNQESGFNIIEE